MSKRYSQNAKASFWLRHRIVWCPKYRRPVLHAPHDAHLEALIREVAAEHSWAVEALRVAPDGVGIAIGTDPTYAVAEVVNRLKARTGRVMRGEFPTLRSRLPTLWSRSYFAASLGAAPDNAIADYISTQKGQ